ncbi:MAG: ABC transporter substrate-binding protein [Bacteroidia bacterium]|nr:ABC transporter substrate-binding protein [Bacteroidia bacterium]
MSIKLGVITSRSNVLPRLGKEFIGGIKSAFASLNMPVPEIVVEDLGLGGSEKTISDLAQKMALQHDPAAIIGLGGSNAFPVFKTIFSANEIPFIFSDLGENFFWGSDRDQYAFRNSLELNRAALFMGKKAADEGRKKLSIASSFYDSGYHLSTAYLRGFEYGGGTIQNWFTHQYMPKPEGFVSYREMLREQSIDQVFAVLSRDEGKYFLETFLQDNILESVTLSGIGTMFLPDFLKDSTCQDGILHGMSWAPSVPGEINEKFKQEIQKHTGKPATFYSLLGWENGLFLAKAITETGSSSPFADDIAAALPKVSVESPRGNLHFNNPNQTTDPSQFLFRSRYHNGNWEQAFEAELEAPGNLEEMLAEEKKIFEKAEPSGWLNPYLGI